MVSFLEMFHGDVVTYTEEDAKAAKPLADWLMAAVRRIEAEEAQQGSFASVDFSACQRLPEPEVFVDCYALAAYMEAQDAQATRSTAKPSLAALSRVAGEKVRGIGWCDA